MSKRPSNPTDKLFDLLQQAHEGTLPEPDRVELNELLRQNPKLIDDFIEYQEQCASLRILHLGTDMPSEAPLFPAPAEVAPSCDLTDGNPATTGLSKMSLFAAPLLALSLIACLVGYTFLTVGAPDNSPSFLTTAQIARQAVIAELIATDQGTCKEHNTQKALPSGTELRQGTVLELASGLARIDYRSGVTLLLQGPSRLELAEPNAVNLHAGVVISRVSPSAIGFTVNTPGSKIIDHGTEFAVGVDEKNTTDVSVLEGKVECVNARGHSHGDGRMLTAGQALRIDAKGGIELFRTIDPSRLAENIKESAEAKRHNARVAIYRLRSASKLKTKGTLVRAINVGGSQGAQVGDIYFEADDDTVLDSFMKLDTGWGNRPWLSNSTEDQALCQVLHSIRHNRARKGELTSNSDRPVSAVMPVAPGRYRIRLLLSENFQPQRSPDRSVNLEIEGVPCLRDLRVLASQGIAGHPIPPNQVLLIDVEMDVVDGELNLSVFSDEVPEDIDPNVILNGLIVERL